MIILKKKLHQGSIFSFFIVNSKEKGMTREILLFKTCIDIVELFLSCVQAI